MNALLDAALAYARRGWHVFPCRRNKSPYLKKLPDGKGGHHFATTDEAVIRGWWQRWPKANIGFVPYKSGHVVLDYDVKDGKRGDKTLAELESKHGDLGRDCHQRSPTGGGHLVFVAPDVEIGDSVADDIDVKHDGYILVAPSMDGGYRWLAEQTPPPLRDTWTPLLRKKLKAPGGSVDAWSKSVGKFDATTRRNLTAALKRVGPESKNNRAWEAARLIFHDYGRSVDEGWSFFEAWNRTRHEPHTVDQLRHEIFDAATNGTPVGRGLCCGVKVKKPTVTVDFSGKEPSEDLYGSSIMDFLGADDPGDDEDAWLVSQVVAAEVPQVIAGHPKSRKTFVALCLALCIASGIDWLGRFKTTRSRVLVLAREDSVRETRRRIWRLARGLGINPHDLVDWLRVDSKTPFYFDNEDDVSRMRRTIEAWRPGLIVIDSLSRTHTGDENSKRDMSVVTSTWGDLCNQYGLSVLLIHHLTKGGDGSLLQRLRGTGDIGAVLRHVFEVKKTAADTARLSFDGNLHPLPDPFDIRITDETTDEGKPCIRLIHGGGGAVSTSNKIDARILKALEEAQPHGLFAKDLRGVGGKGSLIDERRELLLQLGRIRKRDKRYVLVGVAS